MVQFKLNYNGYDSFSIILSQSLNETLKIGVTYQEFTWVNYVYRTYMYQITNGQIKTESDTFLVGFPDQDKKIKSGFSGSIIDSKYYNGKDTIQLIFDTDNKLLNTQLKRSGVSVLPLEFNVGYYYNDCIKGADSKKYKGFFGGINLSYNHFEAGITQKIGKWESVKDFRGLYLGYNNDIISAKYGQTRYEDIDSYTALVDLYNIEINNDLIVGNYTLVKHKDRSPGYSEDIDYEKYNFGFRLSEDSPLGGHYGKTTQTGQDTPKKYQKTYSMSYDIDKSLSDYLVGSNIIISYSDSSKGTWETAISRF